MKRFALLAAMLLALSGAAQAQDFTLAGHGITIRTCAHDAGAVCSVTWAGKEFIDDYDHGRQLQSAISYDGKGENWNPTEAGASIYTDGRNPRPSSSLFRAGGVIGSTLYTNIQMAFWNPVAGRTRSDNIVAKDITIPAPGVIKQLITFSRPAEEAHEFGQYEVLTGYMPAEFGAFYAIKDGVPQALDDGPGEQPHPVVMCTLDAQHCMGAVTAGLPQANYPDAGYGRWRHVRDGVVKWNVVFRHKNPAAYQRYTVYVLVGTLESVTANIVALEAQ